MTASATQPREWDLQTATGMRLRIRELGETKGLPLLILHGYLEQAAAWDEVAARLLARRVVMPDHRGHGLSAHVGPGGSYPFWDYVADVASLVEVLGGRVDLVGHSMGGTMAALYAACRPESVENLVLIEGLGPPDAEDRVVEQARQALRHRLDPPTHRPIADLDEAILRMRRADPALPALTARRLAERSTRPISGGGLEWTFDPRHRARSAQAFVLRQFKVFLREISAPTLMIEGGASPVHAMPDLDARRSCLPHARRVVLDGVGHHPHHECPEALAALVLEHCHARR